MATTQTTGPSDIGAVELRASEPATLPFGGGELRARAFVLERAAGHLLIYSTPTLAAEIAGLTAGRSIARHYLAHHHEAMFLPDPNPLDAPLVVHERDRPAVAELASVPVHAFAKRHLTDPDFEVIPIPGHTPGATAYLWESGEHRYLFSGDSIFVRHGRWIAAVLDSSDRDAYIESLELVRELEFDALVPWVAEASARAVELVDPADARSRIEAVIARLRRGEDN